MPTTTTQRASTKHTAILVYEINGRAAVRSCTWQEGEQACEEAIKHFSGASLFSTDAEWDAEFMMAAYPAIRERVHEAKLKLQNDINLRDALDKHNVPRDRTLRTAIKQAFEDYTSSSLRRALSL